jgi:hypothetical protein
VDFESAILMLSAAPGLLLAAGAIDPVDGRVPSATGALVTGSGA